MNRPDRPALPLPEAAPLDVPADLRERLGALGVALDDAAVAKLARYLGLLLAANAQMNLTAITDPAEAWSRHALDALTLAPHVPPSARVVDVGSGGGVPAIPLAIARPDARFTLVEATQKKAAFLAATAAALGLANVTVRAERAEALAEGPLRGAFDVVTARAVAKLAALVPLTAAFLPRNGTLLFIKGQRADEELAEAAPALARHRVAHVETVATPTGRVVVLRAEGPAQRPPRALAAPYRRR
jgi:16S rRNA (guanine527-N7)-methyltransferase